MGLSQRIPTAAELTLQIHLIDQRPLAVHQQIAGLAKQLHDLGMTNRAIGRSLRMHHTGIAKALRYAESDPSLPHT